MAGRNPGKLPVKLGSGVTLAARRYIIYMLKAWYFVDRPGKVGMAHLDIPIVCVRLGLSNSSINLLSALN